MKMGFYETAQISVDRSAPVTAEMLQDAIAAYSDWTYSVTEAENGWLLKPTFRNMPYRNSFVPEICLRRDGQMLYLTGRPVKAVRIFMLCWFGLLLTLLAALLILTFPAAPENLPFALIPVGIGLLGYLICKLSTKSTFVNVVQAIREGFSDP